MNCDYGRAYLFAKPMRAGQVTEFLNEDHCWLEHESDWNLVVTS